MNSALPAPATGKDWSSALFAYAIWGLFPLFWRLFAAVPAFEIVLQRSLWSAVFLAVLIAISRRENPRRAIGKTWAARKIFIPSALLIATNWTVYVWAVNHGHVLDASLGYFVCPFIQMLLGAVFYREKITLTVGIATAVSLGGVVWIAVSNGLHSFPWVALILSVSFAAYGSIKKSAREVTAVNGAFFESAFLAVPALLFLIYQAAGTTPPVFYSDPKFWFLSLLGGGLTALPLILYSDAAKRLPLSAMGFLQFLNPTIQFALAVTVFGERLDPSKLVGFALIWAGVAIFLGSKLSAPSVRSILRQKAAAFFI